MKQNYMKLTVFKLHNSTIENSYSFFIHCFTYKIIALEYSAIIVFVFIPNYQVCPYITNSMQLCICFISSFEDISIHNRIKLHAFMEYQLIVD